MWFEITMRLEISLEKSELIPIGRVDNVEELAPKIGCKEEAKDL